MKIDHGSPQPLHAQVESMLRELLKEPKYSKGELLPPETGIAKKLGVSRNTIRAAISRLVQEGVLERKAGRGTRFVNQPVRTSLMRWPSFTREMQRRGLVVEVFSLSSEKVRATEEVAQALRLTTEAKKATVTKMERVRGYGEIPAVLSISWFHDRCNLRPDDNFTKPLYELIHEKSGLLVDSSEEEISASIAGKDLAEKLDCNSDDPVLVRKRIVRDAAGKEIEYNINYYRPDRFVYGLTLHQQPDHLQT